MYLRVTSRIFLSISFTFCANISLYDTIDKLDGKYIIPSPIVRGVAQTILVFWAPDGGLKKNPLRF